MDYSDVLVVNNHITQLAILMMVQLPIKVKGEPKITIAVTTPESIFANLEFPITIEILSEDIDITNLTMR